MSDRPDDRAGVTYTVRVEHGRRREDSVTPEHGPVTPPYVHHPSGVSHIKVHVDPTGKTDKEMDDEARSTAYQIAHSTGGGTGKHDRHDMVTKVDIIHLEASKEAHYSDPDWRPHDRLFGPTKGKEDPRLFDADHQMLPEVRQHLMEKMTAFMAKHGGPDWTAWARMYLAGSEASDWYGNNDFDVLVGVDYDGFRQATGSRLTDEEITDAFNRDFRADWNDEEWHPPFDDGVWHLTGYVNQDSYDIRKIKPYAAYDVAADRWAVKPMQVPEDWGPDKFPDSTWRLAEHYANEIDRISHLTPASVQKQHAQRLFDHIHTDRSRAFGPHGTGIFDVGNVAEKYLDQRPDHPLALLVEMKNQPVGKASALDMDPDMGPCTHDGGCGKPGKWYYGGRFRCDEHRDDFPSKTASGKPCSACSGSGEQGTGHECYACDGSGQDRDPGVDNANPENGLLVGRDDAAGIEPVTASDWHQFDTNRDYRQGHVDGARGEFDEHHRISEKLEQGKDIEDHEIDYMVGHAAGVERARDSAAGQHRMKQIWEQHGKPYGHTAATADNYPDWFPGPPKHVPDDRIGCYSCRETGKSLGPNYQGHDYPAKGETCPECHGVGHHPSAAGDFEPVHLPEAQRSKPGEGSEYHRRTLDIAKASASGTHVFRGEMRPKDEDHSNPGSIGIHWSVRDEMASALQRDPDKTHTPVLYHAEISHPDQAIPRSHESWSGRHRSLDTEAEVRFKPGAKVHVHGAYVWHGEGRPRTRAYPTNPGKTAKGWKYHPIGKTVPIEHSRLHNDGLMDYPSLPHHAHMTDDEFDEAWAPEHGSMEGYRPPGKRQQTDEAFHLKRHLEDMHEGEHWMGYPGEERHARENGYQRTNYVEFGRSAKKGDWEPPTVSGIALRAKDTGRILMIQRSNNDEKDPARGTWEFPGGHHEDGDKTSLHAGIREWEEEVGHPFPEGGTVEHTWRTGPYQGHLVVIPEESAVDFSQGRRTTNPDDPDNDDHEQSAWWDPEHARKNPALRQECKDNWSHILPGLKATAVDDSEYSYKHVVHQPKYGDHRYGDSIEPQSPEQVYDAPGRGAHYGAHVFEHQIVHKGTPVGKLRYSILPQDSHVLQINGLAVHPDHQHSGLAVKMADKMQEHAKAHGMKIDHGNYTDQGHAFSRKYMASPNYDPSLHLPYPEKPSATTGEQFLPHMLDPHEMQHGRTASVGGDWIQYYDNLPPGWEIEHDHMRNLRIGGTVHNSQGRVLPRKRTAATQDEQEHRLSSLWFPDHQSTRFQPVQGLIHGARAYAAMKGLPDPHSRDFHKVVTTPDQIRDVGRAYDSLPEHDRTAEGSFHAMRDEVNHQYDHLTGRMGIKVESTHEDPYADVHEMAHDIEHNKRLKVLSTKTTGAHPLFSDEENDKFRAVHDAFGHAATGRGFDRHGEEAAYQAHAAMFTHAARGALTSETRGQNASLNLNGHFGPQKVALMPSHFGRTASIYLMSKGKSTLPKTQKCNWCKGQATKRMLWAEGMAYIPTCDEHETKTRHHIEVSQHDEVVSTRPI